MMELDLACLDDLVLGYLRSERLLQVGPVLCMQALCTRMQATPCTQAPAVRAPPGRALGRAPPAHNGAGSEADARRIAFRASARAIPQEEQDAGDALVRCRHLRHLLERGDVHQAMELLQQLSPSVLEVRPAPLPITPSSAAGSLHPAPAEDSPRGPLHARAHLPPPSRRPPCRTSGCSSGC